MRAGRGPFRLLALLALAALGAACTPAPAGDVAAVETAGTPPSAATAAPAAGSQQALRVLFVGNSYTYFNNLPGMVQSLAASSPSGRRIEAHMVAYGGATLEVHWTRGEAPGRLRSESWDYVVLQEQSSRPVDDPELFFRYARLFDEAIRDAGARTVFFMTWAYESDPGMQAGLTDAYNRIARELRAQVAPVGLAWQQARTSSPPLGLFADDGSHPDPPGSYLAACVFYATLLGADPSGVAAALRDPESRAQLISLDDGTASRLQQYARNATRR